MFFYLHSEDNLVSNTKGKFALWFTEVHESSFTLSVQEQEILTGIPQVGLNGVTSQWKPALRLVRSVSASDGTLKAQRTIVALHVVYLFLNCPIVPAHLKRQTSTCFFSWRPLFLTKLTREIVFGTSECLIGPDMSRIWRTHLHISLGTH